ncbi:MULTISPECIES: exonuclease subunit SbcD [unclassified Microcystis]|jgi:exonuclease SbcD|uniref:Nuclease SbcCD subunit D n=1 Tax=Microcystis flos-aquae Mf_QC_C_20070823_S10D TaxID=2486236 RepID=A0A552KGT6_9CHRO|nr:MULTISPECIES: exonuclease subunit SbcD [unclassified Microcystis]MCA2815737.1 exonuclease subunit SbcD [Microcystis sp. M085S1]MCA2854719.1 exonuclease subunit SbcD [Microcystis sp. M065S1]TRT93159.1 MAG: exonuclease subunit SbcD [Microcystis flos-aquae Ma_QC_C_20070823_S18D]TRV07196.1 MAG: exonuclease subunit SbcD [Microcystis flos-aquae Mf_QC_C_20070823_S10D]TRV28617.1 MAG: exonuclease subunit SbcD [Microcystis flos-aquae Mf_QC_C_20070823_S10]TRV37002.1 MAG: exonuclease subunit SbcD [Mic
MIKILHLSDIHMGSGFSHGRLNPKTGLNTRLEDFMGSLSLCIDRAIASPVDLVLFGGDAFPDATPPPFVHEAFASQFRRLADANIPTVLLVGNHDQHSQGNGGVSLSIYRTLAVPGFIVGDRLTTHRITTRNGDIQVITLPWLTRATLLTRPETEGLSLSGVNELLINRLEPVLEGEIRQLDTSLPTVLLAHLMADRASLGAERFLAVGKGFTVPLSLLNRPQFEYVALGHVHKHQNLNPSNDPPIVYPGSIDRVDFSEEKEDKGYVLIEVAKGEVKWEFCPLPVRTFRSIEVDVSEAENPQKELLKALKKYDIQEAVIRLVYKIRSEQLELINTNQLDEALKTAHSYSIRAELISQLTRPRLPELGVGNQLDPMEALKAYIDNKKDLRDIVDDMLEAAQLLLNQQPEIWLEEETSI